MSVSGQTVSRRSFLHCSLALGAAMVLPRAVMAAVPTHAPDHLALLSDVHVSGGINGMMAKRLTTAIEQVLALPQRPQNVLVAGDCAYLTGNREDYREYVRRIQPLVGAGLPLHMTMGNHDDREHFWEASPSGKVDAHARLHRQAMMIPGRQANWFLLDSLQQTNGHGELGRDQLAWLAAELDARADKPALLMLHHDLVRNGGPGSLRDAESLLAITRPRRHVKAIFFGHTHVWNVTQDSSGIHLVNLPATGYTLWMRSFLGWVSCQVYAQGADLKVFAFDVRQKENGQTVRLKWRAA